MSVSAASSAKMIPDASTIPIVETIYGILYENNNVSSEMKRIAEHFV